MQEKMRDPYKNWKIIAMILAVAVLVLSCTGIFTEVNMSIMFAALLLGAAMCASSGIMALAKGHRVLGYLCSVLAGAFLVLFLIWIVRLIW